MPRPNFVLVMVDDMGYGDFGLFGDGSAQSPTLDRFAAEGVCFSQHYSASPVCAPARATFVTGRYPHRTGAIDTLEGRGLDRLALRERTLGDLFQAAGYATGLVGKWHLGALDPRYHPNARGFGEFVGFRGGWSDYYAWRLDRNGAPQNADGRYLTDVFAEEAVQFIRRHRSEPFLLHLTFNAPHYPFQAPDEEVGPFRETGRFTPSLATLYGMIRRMDRGLARVLEELDVQGLRDNTVVLFTSDNGPQFTGLSVEGGQYVFEGETLRRYNANLSGGKGSVLEGGIRVPAIVRWPAALPGGRRLHEMVHFADWLPTLLDIAGLASPRNLRLDGQSLFPLLRGQQHALETRRFWQWNRYTPLATCNAAMRDGPWKLVRPAIREAMGVSPLDWDVDRLLKYEPERVPEIIRGAEPPREVPPPPPPLLFRVDTDPFEKENLAAAEPERLREMLRALEAWFEEVEADRRSIADVW